MPTRRDAPSGGKSGHGVHGARQHRRRLDPLACAFLGLFVLLAFSAWPALRHHLAALPGNAAIDATEVGRALTEAGLQRGSSSRSAALAALEHNRARRELAQVHLRRARDPAIVDDGSHDDVAAASGALRRALGRAPADHFAWYHLAMAEALGGEPQRAAHALAVAYTFGPYHPPIRAARVRLGIALWPELAPPARELVLAELADVRSAARR